MAVPNLAAVATGDDLSATYWNNTVEPAIDYMANTRPFCYAWMSTIMSPATGVSTAVALDGEAADSTGSMHSTTVNPSRIVLPELGWYSVTAAALFAGNVTGDRLVSVHVNGVLVGRESGPACTAAGNATRYSFSMKIQCTTAGVDYVELFAYQNSGGALALGAGQGTTFLDVLFERV
jgi:hypothetical protein